MYYTPSRVLSVAADIGIMLVGMSLQPAMAHVIIVLH
jgi:hypothetical protein